MESQQQNINIVPRMKTIKAAYQQLKLDDPHTAVSQHFIRQIVTTGKIRSVQAGNKTIFSYDELLDYLSNPPTEEEVNKPFPNGKIRRIN